MNRCNFMHMGKASTFRLNEEVQAGLDLISKLQHRPKNKLVNEAVAEYVTRHSVQAEEELQDTIQRLFGFVIFGAWKEIMVTP